MMESYFEKSRKWHKEMRRALRDLPTIYCAAWG